MALTMASGERVKVLADDLFQAAAPEHISGAIAGVENAVAEEYEHVPGLGAETQFVVVGVVEQSEGSPAISMSSILPSWQ